jgi:CheY-like chemotaxis protein
MDVLVIEDSSDMISAVRALLNGTQYNVLNVPATTTVEDGVQFIKGKPDAVVVLDMRLSGHESAGFDILHKIDEHVYRTDGAAIKILVLTALLESIWLPIRAKSNISYLHKDSVTKLPDALKIICFKNAGRYQDTMYATDGMIPDLDNWIRNVVAGRWLNTGRYGSLLEWLVRFTVENDAKIPMSDIANKVGCNIITAHRKHEELEEDITKFYEIIAGTISTPYNWHARPTIENWALITGVVTKNDVYTVQRNYAARNYAFSKYAIWSPVCSKERHNG